MDTKNSFDLAKARLEAMRAEAEMLTFALASGVILASVEDSQAMAVTDWDDKTTVDAQRRTAEIKSTMQLALRDARNVANEISNCMDVYRAGP